MLLRKLLVGFDQEFAAFAKTYMLTILNFTSLCSSLVSELSLSSALGKTYGGNSYACTLKFSEFLPGDIMENIVVVVGVVSNSFGGIQRSPREFHALPTL